MMGIKSMSNYGVVICGVIIVAVIVQSMNTQTVHVVGDSTGWTVPQGGAAVYSTWASTLNFVVGDNLTFNFATNQHDVVQVPKDSYDSCNSDNAVGDPILNGPANVTLTTTGDHYFICSIGAHCQNGQKLAITVVSASGPGSSPTSPTTPSNSTNPPRASPTPFTPADCAPSPASSPTARGPATSQNSPPPAPSGSSSPAVFAAFLLSAVLSIAVCLFFSM